MPVARLDQIVKRYGAEEVLRGVSLSVEEGEWLALTGRSGSGKSTLLHILGGLDRRFSGTAEVFARFRNAEVGFVFQAFNLLDHLTVRENVALPAFFAGGKSAGAPDGERALAALERVGMAGHAARRPGELSGGQKQRVALARALYGGPRLLLADEPTGNLDGETGRQIIELFGKLHQEGLTLIVVTHQERVSEAAGRVLRLEDGRLLA